MKGVYTITQEEAGLVRVQVIGDLSVQAVETLVMELEHCKGANGLILADLRRMTSPMPALAHGVLLRALHDYRTVRVAVFGGSPLVMYTMRTAVSIAGVTDRVRVFGREDEAVEWLGCCIPVSLPIRSFAQV
jgi:hypothetical protein